jgi:methionyl-tRNA formyltransferase
MQMNEGLDTGDMLLQKAVSIGADETAAELHDRLAALGAQLVIEALNTQPAPVKQDDAQASYAAKLSKEEAVIKWHEDAILIQRKVSAFNPFPGASSMLGGERIKIWRAQVVASGPGTPGVVCASPAGQLVVACGLGALSIEELQRAGGKRMATAQFLAGFPIIAGTRLGSVGA